MQVAKEKFLVPLLIVSLLISSTPTYASSIRAGNLKNRAGNFFKVPQNRVEILAANSRTAQSYYNAPSKTAFDQCVFHKYLYTHGDPVNGIDPTRLFFTLSGLGARMASGARLVSSSLAATGRTLFALERALWGWSPWASAAGHGVAAYFLTLWAGNTYRSQIGYTETVNLFVSTLAPHQAGQQNFTEYRSLVLQRASEIAESFDSVTQGRTKVNIVDGNVPEGLAGYNLSTKTLNVFVRWRDGDGVIAQGNADNLELLPNGFYLALSEAQNNRRISVPVNPETKSQYLSNAIKHELAHSILARGGLAQLYGFLDHKNHGLMQGGLHGNMSFNRAGVESLEFDAVTAAQLNVALGLEWGPWR